MEWLYKLIRMERANSKKEIFSIHNVISKIIDSSLLQQRLKNQFLFKTSPRIFYFPFISLLLFTCIIFLWFIYFYFISMCNELIKRKYIFFLLLHLMLSYGLCFRNTFIHIPYVFVIL